LQFYVFANTKLVETKDILQGEITHIFFLS
jgi:hypothetical protein